MLPKAINRRVGRAMHEYAMLDDGDRVLVAVSGGVDSSVLAYILQTWLAKAPINYSLKAVYIDNGFWQPASGGRQPGELIAELMERFGINFKIIQGRDLGEELSCYQCARNRRSQLFELARQWHMNKIAFGHHMDDMVETLYLNMLYSGNISTMVPKQKLFSGRLHIVRPLAYVEKDAIRQFAQACQIEAVKNYCPNEKDTKREIVRQLLVDIYQRVPGAKKSLLHSMKNVRKGYMP